MKLKRKPKRNIWLLVFTGLVIIEWTVLIFWFTNLYQSRNLSDEQQIRRVFEKCCLKVDHYRSVIFGIDIDGNWAVGSIGARYLDTGKPVALGPGLIVFRKILGRWYTSRGWWWLEKIWIRALPNSLLPEEVKPWFLGGS